ncbi:hypothetical protein GGH94_003393 [Coemansia aciculifera]|uniref:Complex 1 LYR protein domain-containing protein n=1 Tax=Coemansia aciculifera TaxID=417176 RepID=A0A9W8M697_9FUNG|nr:hypothetical protein GGH94_003393 [Coemansia aciculifera]
MLKLFRPKQPFFRKTWHKQRILSVYRRLLRQARQFSDPVERQYLWSWVRERFHHNKRQTSPTQVGQQLSDAHWASLAMESALDGNKEQIRYIGDLAYGRTGWLKHVAQYVGEFHHPTKSCDMLRDVRPRSSRIHQPHPAYRIPLDLRAFRVPPYLLQRMKEEDERKQRKREELDRRKLILLGRELGAMTEAVRRGNVFLRDSGLLPGAFSSNIMVRNANYIPGVAGNVAWTPPKIKARVDPPFVQHVRASSGFEFYKVNARKPPQWLGNRIKASYEVAARNLLMHEFYFHFVDDLKLEEEFEARLGIEDRGYWKYAANYRDYLRYRIKNGTFSSDDNEASLMSHDIEDLEECQRLTDYVTEMLQEQNELLSIAA